MREIIIILFLLLLPVMVMGDDSTQKKSQLEQSIKEMETQYVVYQVMLAYIQTNMDALQLRILVGKSELGKLTTPKEGGK
jgi:hypothetical protein